MDIIKYKVTFFVYGYKTTAESIDCELVIKWKIFNVDDSDRHFSDGILISKLFEDLVDRRYFTEDI